MKKLILLFAFLFSSFSFSGYVPKIKSGFFRSKQNCELFNNEQCFKVKRGINKAYHEYLPSAQLKEQTLSCLNEIDCETQFQDLTCISEGFGKIKNLDLLEVYCTKYRPEGIHVNQTLKDSYDAEKLSNLQEKQAKKTKKDNASQALKNWDCENDSNLSIFQKQVCIYLKNK